MMLTSYTRPSLIPFNHFLDSPIWYSDYYPPIIYYPLRVLGGAGAKCTRHWAKYFFINHNLHNFTQFVCICYDLFMPLSLSSICQDNSYFVCLSVVLHVIPAQPPARTYHSSHRAGRGQVTSPWQTTIHSQVHTYRQFRGESFPHLCDCGRKLCRCWQELHTETPHVRREEIYIWLKF